MRPDRKKPSSTPFMSPFVLTKRFPWTAWVSTVEYIYISVNVGVHIKQVHWFWLRLSGGTVAAPRGRRLTVMSAIKTSRRNRYLWRKKKENVWFPLMGCSRPVNNSAERDYHLRRCANYFQVFSINISHAHVYNDAVCDSSKVCHQLNKNTKFILNVSHNSDDNWERKWGELVTYPYLVGVSHRHDEEHRHASWIIITVGWNSRAKRMTLDLACSRYRISSALYSCTSGFYKSNVDFVLFKSKKEFEVNGCQFDTVQRHAVQ